MKDYARLVIWTDYFDSTLSRSGGRKVPISSAIKRPTLPELAEAAGRIGVRYERVEAAHPKRGITMSGYLSVERTKPKTLMIKELAGALAKVRGEKKETT